MIRLVIADDQAVVRAGLSVILGAEEDIEVVGEAADGAEAIALARELRPDVVCMDIRMPGTDGIAATRAIVSDPDLDVDVLILTTFDVDDDVLAVHCQGVSGRAAQGRVEDGAVLGDVDVLAVIHGVAAARDVYLLGELDQGVADVVGQQVLGQVDVEVSQLVGEALGALGVVGEPGAQVWGHGVVELGEALPGGRGGGINRIQHGYSLWVSQPRATLWCQPFSHSRSPVDF